MRSSSGFILACDSALTSEDYNICTLVELEKPRFLVMLGCAVISYFLDINQLVTWSVEVAGGEKNAPQGWGRYHNRERVRNLLFGWTGDR